MCFKVGPRIDRSHKVAYLKQILKKERQAPLILRGGASKYSQIDDIIIEDFQQKEDILCTKLRPLHLLTLERLLTSRWSSR
jgi:hypothetical protein